MALKLYEMGEHLQISKKYWDQDGSIFDYMFLLLIKIKFVGIFAELIKDSNTVKPVLCTLSEQRQPADNSQPKHGQSKLNSNFD